MTTAAQKTKATKALNKRVDAHWATVKAMLTTEALILGLLCLEHFQVHGDTGPILRFHNGAPKALRNPIRAWVCNHAPVKFENYNSTTKEYGNATKAEEGSKFYRPFDLEAAKNNPFYDASGDPKPAKLPDALQAMKNQVKKLRKMLTGEVTREDGITDEEIKAEIAKDEKIIAFIQKAA